jgi:hypothetical protein
VKHKRGGVVRRAPSRHPNRQHPGACGPHNSETSSYPYPSLKGCQRGVVLGQKVAKPRLQWSTLNLHAWFIVLFQCLLVDVAGQFSPDFSHSQTRLPTIVLANPCRSAAASQPTRPLLADLAGLAW